MPLQVRCPVRSVAVGENGAEESLDGRWHDWPDADATGVEDVPID